MKLIDWLSVSDRSLFWFDDGAIFGFSQQRGSTQHLFHLKEPKTAHMPANPEYIGTFDGLGNVLYCKKKGMKLLGDLLDDFPADSLENLIDSINSEICRKVEEMVSQYGDLFLALNYRSDDFNDMEARFNEMELESLKEEILISGQNRIQYICAYTGRMNQNFLGFLERYFRDPASTVEREVLRFFDENQDEVVYQLRTQKAALNAAASETELSESVRIKRKINDALLTAKGKKVKLVFRSGDKERVFDVDKIKILGTKVSFPISILTQKQAGEYMEAFGMNYISLAMVDEIRCGKSVLYVKNNI